MDRGHRERDLHRSHDRPARVEVVREERTDRVDERTVGTGPDFTRDLRGLPNAEVGVGDSLPVHA